MKKWILAVCMAASTLVMQAQDIVLKGYDAKDLPEAEKQALRKIGPPSFQLPVEYPCKQRDGSAMTWQYLAQAKISNFMYNIREYSSATEVDKAVACGYSVFGLANHTETFANLFSHDKDEQTVQTIFTIYMTQSYHDLLYVWMKPSLTAAWAAQEPRFKDTFREMMSYIVSYLNTLDMEKETAYFKEKEAEFAYRDRLGEGSPYRKGAAWCFRRIQAGHMDKAYILSWCDKINKEIMK